MERLTQEEIKKIIDELKKSGDSTTQLLRLRT